MQTFKRSLIRRRRVRVAAGLSGAALLAGTAWFPAYGGEPGPTREELQELRLLIQQQEQQLKRQQDALETQRRRLEALERRPGQPQTAASPAPAGQPGIYNAAIVTRPPYQDPGPTRVQAERAPTTQTESDGEERAPEIPAVLVESSGILTPKGTLSLEPSFEYTKSTSNRLNFRGISVVEGFLIGIIEATDADRDTFTGSMTGRYGVTNRLEVELEVPYVYRNDRITSTVTGTGGDFQLTDTVDGDGIGDIEFAAHYQLNSGRGGWPFFVANARVKSDTGDGPFDVARDGDGVPRELATGSGFWSFEPSVTMLYPTDPAVLFLNVGYLFNFEKDIDQMVGGSRIGTIDPGDAIRFGFGVGLALNERLSMSLGYSHDVVLETETEIDGVTTGSEELSVGSLQFGLSYRLSDRVNLNVTTELGATEDAPDVSLKFRVPVKLGLF